MQIFATKAKCPCGKDIQSHVFKKRDKASSLKVIHSTKVPAKKKSALESICATCNCSFQMASPREKLKKECGSCEQKTRETEREKERIKLLTKEKKDYFKYHGVGYQPVPSLRLCREPLRNEALVGAYKLVYYSSSRPCATEESECIHRTVRGDMQLSTKKWNGIPALYGEYSFFDAESTPLGVHQDTNEIKASFIERVSGPWMPPLPDDETSKDSDDPDSDSDDSYDTGASKVFYLRQESHPHWNLVGSDWWRDIDEEVTEYPDDLMTEEMWCQASMMIVDQRCALGLESDELYYLNYVPNTSGVVPTNANHADEMMATYKNGRNSWTCKHLGVPCQVASRIREFVTPPPVFFLEPGDLLLDIEDAREMEWTKCLVYRKEA
jgi:hypothetical protein